MYLVRADDTLRDVIILLLSQPENETQPLVHDSLLTHSLHLLYHYLQSELFHIEKVSRVRRNTAEQKLEK